MKYQVLNQEGKKIKETLLPKEIFGVKINSNLVHQIVVSQMSNKRAGTAHVKDRGDVRGGGKKPWRQKGLGKARHGSTRSPIWVGGGVSFGPTKEKNFKKKIPKKMRRLALSMVLSTKVNDKSMVLLDELKIEKPKTKIMTEILKNLSCQKGSTLFALSSLDKDVIRATRNIPKTKTIQAKDLNCLDLLNFKFLVMSEKSIEIIKETFFKKIKHTYDIIN